MTKQAITVSAIVFLIGFFSPFGASAQAAEPAFDLINQVQGDLTQANTLLNEVEQAVFTNEVNDIQLVVSLTEIRNKITLAQDFLSQAITAYEAGNYSQALIDAKFARSNSELAVYYINSLLRRPSQFNISSLFLQGDLSDLLKLRDIFTINTIANRLATLLDSTSSENNQTTSQVPTSNDITGDVTNDDSIDTNDNIEIPSAETPVDNIDDDSQTENDTVDTPPVASPVQCLKNGKLTCGKNLKTCLAAKKAPVSTCKLNFTRQQSKCDGLTKKANTRLASCQVKRTDCLAKVRNAKASLSCANNFDKCAINAKKQADRDNKLAQSCQGRVNQAIIKCEAVYTEKTVKFERSVYGCFDKQNTCLAKVETTCRK